MKVKREIDKEDEGKRVGYFSLILVIVFLVFISKLTYLQIIKGEGYRERAVRNSLRTNTVKAVRGKIYDVNGKILADNTTGYKIIHKFTKSISESEKKILIEMQKNKIDALKNETKQRANKLNEIYDDITYICEISNSTFEDILEVFYGDQPFASNRDEP